MPPQTPYAGPTHGPEATPSAVFQAYHQTAIPGFDYGLADALLAAANMEDVWGEVSPQAGPSNGPVLPGWDEWNVFYYPPSFVPATIPFPRAPRGETQAAPPPRRLLPDRHALAAAQCMIDVWGAAQPEQQPVPLPEEQQAA